MAGQIVTKDDFEEHASAAPLSHDGAIDLGPKGVFFRQFGDLLNWKNTNYEKEQQMLPRNGKNARGTSSITTTILA